MKEEAQRLVDRFSKEQINQSSFENFQVAKQCAIICCEEVKELCVYPNYYSAKFVGDEIKYSKEYWDNLIEEIKKL